MRSQENEKRGPSGRTRAAGLLKYLSIAMICLAAAGLCFIAIKPSPGIGGQKTGQAMPPLPVIASAVERKDVNLYISGIGSVTPINTVTVRTRVDGEVMKVLYREGQTVKKGELLLQIDPRPFEVQLMQAEGQIVRDKAILKNARIDLARYRVLWAQNSIPEQQMVTQKSLVHQYEGVVKTDQAAIDSAKLQLAYAHITAPISGRVGLRLVDPGNIVHAADANGLAVITQLQPITVIFSIPEDDIPRVLKRLETGDKLTVEAYDRDQRNRLATGSLLAIDNQIDPATGTVRLRAVFPNKDDGLFPNQFVNARLFVESLHDVMVIPAEAIQHGPRGAFVYAIRPDQTVAMRPVSLGVIQEDRAVVKSGLHPGELVVVDGADRLRNGSKVKARILDGGVMQKDKGGQNKRKGG